MLAGERSFPASAATLGLPLAATRSAARRREAEMDSSESWFVI